MENFQTIGIEFELENKSEIQIPVNRFKVLFFQYFKISIFWTIFIFIILEFILLKFKLNDLPLKFHAHLSGPIQRLSQYSKKNSSPENYIAILGDSYASGFGPWLYDLSWSWQQPAYATQHIIFEQTGIDCITYGYPGYGSLGTAVSMVAENNFFSKSPFWSNHEKPKLILLFFYEGNDLINNLHEIQKRKFEEKLNGSKSAIESVQQLMAHETVLKSNHFGWSDKLATINLLKGLLNNYLSHSDQISTPKSSLPSGVMAKETIVSQDVENMALINDQILSLGYAEGPALHLSESEIDQSLFITEQSISYLRGIFHTSRIALVYIPSALSLYEFDSDYVRPAPLELNGSTRDKAFKPEEVREKCDFLRKRMSEIAERQKVCIIDPVLELRRTARKQLLHGPRDPIHFNREGYKAFANSIIHDVRNSFNKP